MQLWYFFQDGANYAVILFTVQLSFCSGYTQLWTSTFLITRCFLVYFTVSATSLEGSNRFSIKNEVILAWLLSTLPRKKTMTCSMESSPSTVVRVGRLQLCTMVPIVTVILWPDFARYDKLLPGVTSWWYVVLQFLTRCGFVLHVFFGSSTDCGRVWHLQRKWEREGLLERAWQLDALSKRLISVKLVILQVNSRLTV